MQLAMTSLECDAMTCHDRYDEQQPPQPRIVVGVDGSPGSYAAMRWATEQAQMSGATISAVCVLEPVVPLDFTGAGFAAVSQLDPRELQRCGHEVLSHVIDGATGGNADDIDRAVIEASNPGQALVRAARGASMLVVGAHRHHGLGFLLGSTGASCVRQATCPVVVIPAESATAPESADYAPREEALT
jgi:nucleotide-binding universal stress UspA family protein